MSAASGPVQCQLADRTELYIHFVDDKSGKEQLTNCCHFSNYHHGNNLNHWIQTFFLLNQCTVIVPQPAIPASRNQCPKRSSRLRQIFCSIRVNRSITFSFPSVAASMGCPGYPWISLRFQCFRIRRHIATKSGDIH